MVRLWVSPEGEWRPYVARSDVAHLGLANEIIFEHGYVSARLPDFEDPDYIEKTSALTGSLTPSELLESKGWVRYSEGNIEGTPEAIRKHWFLIRDFAESDTIRHGMDAPVFFDIVDEQGKRVRSFSTSLGEVLRAQPPAGVFREPSLVQQFRRRPVRVRQYRRRR